MAFLLLLHEKMRLKRQVNKLTLKQLKFGNRLDRMTKNISRVQKMYSSRMTQLEKQAQMLQSQASVFFQNAMGLGAQGQMFNPYGYASSGAGMTTFVINQVASMLNGSHKMPDGNGGTVDVNISGKYQAMMQEYMAGTLRPQYEKDSNNNVDTTKLKGYGANGNYTQAEYQLFTQAIQQAQNNQSQAQAYCQHMNADYQANVSVWLEAQKAQLEAEQDAALAPLEAEQTDMELEKESVETQLEYARERLKAIEQACKEEIQDAAPKFGLG